MTSPETCPAPRHDTASAYNAGCRCPLARDARRIDKKRRKLEHLEGRYRRVPATGTHRRIRALARIGWPAWEIGNRMGISDRAVQQLLLRRAVFRHNAEKVERIYDELSMTPGRSTQTQRRAIRNGWPPPLAWDDDEIDDPRARPYSARKEHLSVDEIAVTEAMSGRAVHLTKAEKREVALRLSRLGLSAAEIADRMGTNREAAAKLVTRGKAAA